MRSRRRKVKKYIDALNNLAGEIDLIPKVGT